MNRILWFLLGYRQVTITGGSVQWFLNRLSKDRIPFWNLQWIDEFSVCFRIFPRDLEGIVSAAQREQCEVISIAEEGARFLCMGIVNRVWLWCMILLTTVSLCVVQNFLLFYEVTGNERVHEELVLRELDSLGISVGTYGPSIKPRWIKDHVLNLLPQLQWITVTQNGCRATVVVRERTETPDTLDRKGYAHVLAARGGLITSQQIFSGQPMKQVGDIVSEGELLVSGLVDLERVFTMEYAQAEIYARTWRKKTVVSPDNCLQTTTNDRIQRCIWLEIGKNRIKIFGNSGISTIACDKMINRKILSLPDGLTLPVSVLIETLVPWVGNSTFVNPETVVHQLRTYTEKRVNADMCAGKILSHAADWNRLNGCIKLASVLECHEMIAKTVEAKWSKEDFADD